MAEFIEFNLKSQSREAAAASSAAPAMLRYSASTSLEIPVCAAADLNHWHMNI